MSKHLQRIVRRKELPSFCGLKKSQINDLIKDGKFPQPFKLNPPAGRAVGWFEEDLIAWQQSIVVGVER